MEIDFDNLKRFLVQPTTEERRRAIIIALLYYAACVERRKLKSYSDKNNIYIYISDILSAKNINHFLLITVNQKQH